jgi:uncharacterized protein (TIGR04255 family)
MTGKILKNKPLREAIFEFRWELDEPEPGLRLDPHYKLLIGSLYDSVKSKYPFHEPLPTSTMPDEMAAYIIQHRFRVKKKGWPLIQIGPGIFTLNETKGYVWGTFEKAISEGLDSLFSSYSELGGELKTNSVMLRYIDAIDFDYENDAFEFLREKMKININLGEQLFRNTGITQNPLGFNFIMTFNSTKPVGAMSLRFSRGRKDESDAIIWETIFQSKGDDSPATKDDMINWLEEGHKLTHDWFFKIIQGDLEERFE